MSIKLKTCPFCGGEAKYNPDSSRNRDRVWVRCIKCGAESKPADESVDYCAKDVVAGYWNARTADATPLSADTNFANLSDMQIFDGSPVSGVNVDLVIEMKKKLSRYEALERKGALKELA